MRMRLIRANGCIQIIFDNVAVSGTRRHGVSEALSLAATEAMIESPEHEEGLLLFLFDYFFIFIFIFIFFGCTLGSQSTESRPRPESEESIGLIPPLERL